MQAASISWSPTETTPVKGGRWRDTHSELLEWSIVAVPADPDALRKSHLRMIEAVVAEPSDDDLEGVAEAIHGLREVLFRSR